MINLNNLFIKLHQLHQEERNARKDFNFVSSVSHLFS